MADESDIAVLMRRDPLELTRQDIESIIQYHRENRARYELGDAAPKKVKKPKNPSLEDLGL